MLTGKGTLLRFVVNLRICFLFAESLHWDLDFLLSLSFLQVISSSE